MAFAIDLIKGNKTPDQCPEFNNPKYSKNLPQLVMLLAPLKQEQKASASGHIEVDEEKCDGCGLCVVACPVNSRYELDCLSGKGPLYPTSEEIVYHVENGKCKIMNLENCRRYEPDRGDAASCKVCETYCPRTAIKIYE